MNVLIVGCGYVGLALGAELVKQGHSVCGVRRTSGGAKELSDAGIRLLVADITSPKTLPMLSERYDWVVHCVSTSGGNARDYERVYLQGTRHLLSWLSLSPPRKFVYTSSTSVYGQIDGSAVDETSTISADSDTVRVLVAAEQLLLEAAQTGFPAVVLRLAGIYGPGRAHWLEQARRWPAKAEGVADRFVNMVHQRDVVGAIEACLERAKPGQIYNAVDDEPVKLRALLAWLSTRLHLPTQQAAPSPQLLPQKRGLTNKRVLNRKLKEELGYRFQYPTFREGYDSLIRHQA